MGYVDLLFDGTRIRRLRQGEFPVDLGKLAQSLPILWKILGQNGGDKITLAVTQRNEIQIRSNQRQRPIQPGFDSRILVRQAPFNVDDRGENPVVVTNFQITNRLHST